MNQLAKFVVWTVLPLMALGISAPSLADATLPVAQVVTQLRQQTRLPIFMPGAIAGIDEQIYVDVDATPTRYDLSFDFAPDCQGATACNFGSMSAERNGQFPTRADINPTDTLEPIVLANGLRGRFINTCGAYCTASVQWQYQNVLYSATIKNGERAEVLALANAAIQAGVRTR